MLKLDLTRPAKKFLKSLPPKQVKQVARKIIGLRENPLPHDSKQLKGKHSRYRRADIGEYRVVYYATDKTLFVVLIGKRNDDEVYKKLSRR